MFRLDRPVKFTGTRASYEQVTTCLVLPTSKGPPAVGAGFTRKTRRAGGRVCRARRVDPDAVSDGGRPHLVGEARVADLHDGRTEKSRLLPAFHVLSHVLPTGYGCVLRWSCSHDACAGPAAS